jgi:hypothetical protein
MERIEAAAKSKFDIIGQMNEAVERTENVRKNSRIDKDLPLNPAEQAGLREHARSYSRELHSKTKVEVDPNHAWPTAKLASTLRLS